MPTPDITFPLFGTHLLLLLNFEPSNVFPICDCAVVFVSIVSGAKGTQSHEEERDWMSLNEDFSQLCCYQESGSFYTG